MDHLPPHVLRRWTGLKGGKLLFPVLCSQFMLIVINGCMLSLTVSLVCDLVQDQMWLQSLSEYPTPGATVREGM